MNAFFCFSSALESLGFGSYIAEVKDVLQECKTVALKRRKASSRLENLGIPEEELLRQQQELFAKVKSLKELELFVKRINGTFRSVAFQFVHRLLAL